MLYWESLPDIPEIIRIKQISKHHDKLLINHFEINKTKRLITQKYYRPSLWVNVETYVKTYNICLTSKTVRYKRYGDLQLLLISSYWCKDLFMDFVTELPVSINWKGKIFNLILVIVERLTKMVYYKRVQIIIDTFSFLKVIINIIVRHHSLLDLIVSN